MAAETMTSLDRILKEYYPAQGIVNQLNVDTFLLDKVEKAKRFQNVGGRYLYKPARFGLSGGVGPRAENSSLPTPGTQIFDDIQIPVRFHYGVIQVTGPVMAVSKTDKQAFAEALALTMDGMYDEFRLVASILAYGWGSAIVGRATSVSGQVLTLKDDIHPINWFYEGLNLQVYDSDEVTIDAGSPGPFQVSSVDLSARTITLSGDISSVDSGDVLVLSGSLNVAPQGLLGAVDDGTYVSTYFGISRSARGRWKSYVDVASGATVTKYGNTARRAITGSLLQGALDAQRQRAGAARPVDQIISSLGVRRNYWNSLSPDRRFDSAIYDGGWEMLKFSNGDRTIPWFGDEFAPRYTLFGLHTGTVPAGKGKKSDKVQDEEVLAVYEALPADWDTSTGSEMKQVYSGAAFVDAVGAFLKWYYNFGTCRPNLFMRMDDLSES